ncbi:hypothetical protein DID77_01495 [Candidatus Marinamargulisbacteria bacterium SCGC AG-439-L15]|nr:hypothetical protein DID77_01495 [Candidatus Marinamargulisbacteria bacterium SCGC AG-439-L15]
MPIIIYQLIDLLFQFLNLALFVRIVLSWIPHDPYHPLISFVYSVTTPILRPFQDLIPAHRMGIDISPIFAFIALGVLRKVIFQLL